MATRLEVDLSSDAYHTTEGTYSSSQLKTMNEDPEKFYKDYITKENARKTMSAFDIGTYFHTAVLEPHLLEKECAVYTGGKRLGKAWDDFQELNKGKAIITRTEMEIAEKMIKAVQESPIGMSYLTGFQKEISAFVDVYVYEGDIYTQTQEGDLVLTKNGWDKSPLEVDDIEIAAVKLTLKVRADAIDFKNGKVSDLKSTSGNTKSAFLIKQKIDSYSYDLSAALYLDIFEAASGCPMKEFAWIFASKDFGNSKTWIASGDNIRVGRAKWREAVIQLAFYVDNGWTFTDTLDVLEPSFFQREWLLKWEKEV